MFASNARMQHCRCACKQPPHLANFSASGVIWRLKRVRRIQAFFTSFGPIRDTIGGFVYAGRWNSGLTEPYREETTPKMRQSTHGLLGFFAFLAASCVATFATARTNTLRIVTYNIEADTPGIETPGWTTPRPGLIQPADASGNAVGTTSQGGVLEAHRRIARGHEQQQSAAGYSGVAGNHQQHTHDRSHRQRDEHVLWRTPGKYARSPVQGSNSGGSGNADFGNGPNALVYNTQKMSLIASVGVGTVFGSSTGEYRQVMRYQFRPAGGTSADDFYIYVSHYKSGGGSTNRKRAFGRSQYYPQQCRPLAVQFTNHLRRRLQRSVQAPKTPIKGFWIPAKSMQASIRSTRRAPRASIGQPIPTISKRPIIRQVLGCRLDYMFLTAT